MSDKELLELAAKAAGIAGRAQCWHFYIPHEDKIWDPLTDDGDALRLAVKLEISVIPSMEQYTSARNSTYTPFMNEDCGSDPYAATRRAIVRAATEIGKELP